MTSARTTPGPAADSGDGSGTGAGEGAGTGAGTTDTLHALSWWDGSTLTSELTSTATSTAAATTSVTGASSTAEPLLAVRPRRSPLRPGVLVPIGLVVAVLIAYGVTMGVWPLTAVAPSVTATAVTAPVAPAASLTWPKAGSAAVAVEGLGTTLASADTQVTMASITKVVTALVVLDRMPLQAGQSGPEFRFTYGDRAEYWQFLRRNESALDVPAGGTLTQYQLLEGMLLGSAGNYATRLAYNLWPGPRSFSSAASDWLAAHGVTGISITDPTGIDPGNTARPAALIRLAEVAMDDPVIAEIVAKKSVTLPGAGEVKNTNTLIGDAGVVGLKTGTLDGYNLLVSKDVQVGGTTVQIDAVTLHQPSEKVRTSATRALLAQVEKQLAAAPVLPAGTTVGTVRTDWGESVKVVTTADAAVALWNGARATATTTLKLGDHRAKGDVVGSLTAKGPVDAATVDVSLAGDVDGPDLWWRLTHPAQLLGIG